jgi:hypothetical protein
MIVRGTCPTCESTRYKKNGHTRHGQQNHQCKASASPCVGSCRVMGVSLTRLLHFMQVIAFHVGDRSRERGAQLWTKLPAGYQPQAIFHHSGGSNNSR